MNILVTALSLYRTLIPLDYVLTLEGKDYTVTGEHTNEPVPKALRLYLAGKQQKLSKIIVLCTPATLVPDEAGSSSYDKFCAAICRAWEGEEAPQFHRLCLDEMADSRAIYGASMKLVELLQECQGPNLYIDSTGGFRDAMMFFISMMQLLKEQNIHVSDVLYTVYDRTAPPPYRIISRMDAYGVYDLVSGMEEMKTYGDPRKLKEYFRGRPISDHAVRILDTMQSVYTEMQLCRVEQSKNALIRLSGLLDTYTPGDSTFDTVVTLAKRKYGGIREGLSYQEYIRWYFDHGYVAQTLAFFYETLPDILVENRVLYATEDILAGCCEQRDKLVERRTGNYTFINRYFRENYQQDRASINQAREELEALAKRMDPACLSQVSQNIHKAMRQLLLAKVDSRLLKNPSREMTLIMQGLGIVTGEDVLKYSGETAMYNKIRHNEVLVCRLYEIEKSANKILPAEHARLIVSAIDGKRILLGQGVDKADLEALLEKYFYLKEQRNSVLHVGQASASPKTLAKNINEAITLMEAVLAKENET